MAGNTGFGWTFFGTILCGLVFAIPIFLIYFLVRAIVRSAARRKAKAEKSESVLTT